MKLRKICIYRAEFRATTSSAADCDSFSRVFLPATGKQVSRNTKASNENIKLVRLDKFMQADFLGNKNYLRSKLMLRNWGNPESKQHEVFETTNITCNT